MTEEEQIRNIFPPETEASLRSKGFKRKDLPSTTEKRYTEAVPADNMIMVALNAGRTMDEVQKLIEMRNEEIKRIAKLNYLHAMGEFQAICPNLVKSKEVKYDHREGGGKTNYKYLDLAGIQDFIRVPLSSQGLSVAWTTTEEKNIITVTCTCSHEGGHSESTTLSGEADISGKKNNIQSKASTITYLRRYTLTGVLGISTGDIDNDGRDAAAVSVVSIVKPLVPSPGMYKNLLDSVMRKSISVEEVEKHYQLSDEQLETLKNIQ